MKTIYFLILLVIFSACNKNTKVKEQKQLSEFNARIGNITDFKTIAFPSKDGLTITADLYLVKDAKSFILLCHQAGYSRGEYIETAKKLNKMGYSCLAIDQRSGKEVNNIINETAKLALEKGIKVTTYIDAKPDIEAAIDYAYGLNNEKPIILIGSSYSASLSLLIATVNEKVKAVVAFSPGEYIKGVEVAKTITPLNKPIFVCSSKKEITQVESLIKNIKSTLKIQFKPHLDGIHGSRMLWKKTKSSKAAWQSFSEFLAKIK